MKKLLTLIAVLGLSVSLIGCDGGAADAKKPAGTPGTPEAKTDVAAPAEGEKKEEAAPAEGEKKEEGEAKKEETKEG